MMATWDLIDDDPIVLDPDESGATGPAAGVTDKFPMGVITNKGLTVRSAQQHGHRYVRRLLAHIAAGDLDPSFLATHPMRLEDAVEGYDLFKHKDDGCVRAVFVP
jgi:threonine dehydrogenase-like Zn-dependent dehydrogenase